MSDPKYWPTAAARALLGTPAPDPVPEPCDLCGGTGWASYPDPFFGGALVDARCPACQDDTVRAKRRRWETDDGRRVGPA